MAYMYLFSFLVEAIILWQYTSALFVTKQKTTVKLSVLCSLYLILFAAAQQFGSIWLNSILCLFLNFIFLATQYRIKWQSALFHSSILVAVSGMCELMVYGIISYIAPHFLQMRDFYHLILFAFLSKTMYFAITFLIICFLKRWQKDNRQYDNSLLLLVFIPIASLFVMLTLVNIIDQYTLSHTLEWLVILSAVFLLGINLLVFGINQYHLKKNTEFTEVQLLLQKESDAAEYYKMLLLQNENQSILIHDIKKHLQSIHTLNEQKEHDRINSYICQLMLSSDLKETARLCDHEMLNAILCRYKRQCIDKHIMFHADIRSGTIDFLADTDLTSLFCNLLDNALEAADGIPDSFIEITTGKKEKTPLVVITIINSSRIPSFSNQSDSPVTSKSDKGRHGFGIKSIRKTVNKYHGDMKMYYSNETLTFHTIITLKQ